MLLLPSDEFTVSLLQYSTGAVLTSRTPTHTHTLVSPSIKVKVVLFCRPSGLLTTLKNSEVVLTFAVRSFVVTPLEKIL